jgi:hypothetical protein
VTRGRRKRRYFEEIFNHRNFEVCNEILTEDYIEHRSPGVSRLAIIESRRTCLSLIFKASFSETPGNDWPLRRSAPENGN